MQASLCIDNLSHSWLSRLFTAEYAGQFDAVLPGMSRFALRLAARRLLQSLPHGGAARGRRLGPFQRHRGRRSRLSSRPLWLSRDQLRLGDL
ncbi:MAG: hypothetical protein MZV49_16760 [Rhodopseudomonas palustris]|nr:hypothetical protein [Rhodopseudomonas palustris]